ncbi:hypothetical protein TNCV_1908951 [Trichonephila clavipes]|nr:hypothetical protein TNCV_1908951 [Trichonephila clavipes]
MVVGLSNISKYPGYLPDIAGYDGNPFNQGLVGVDGTCINKTSYGPRRKKSRQDRSVTPCITTTNYVDDFTCGRVIGNLEDGSCLTSVSEEFGINKIAVSRFWKAFQTILTAVRKVGDGHPKNKFH